jgi:hypothetical protein
MASTRSNGAPADCPAWAWALVQEVRGWHEETALERKRFEADRKRADDDRKRADDDRKRADDDRKRAEEDRKRADDDRKRAEKDRRRADEFIEDIQRTNALIAQAQISIANSLAEMKGHMIELIEGQRNQTIILEKHTGYLQEILKALKIRGNGQGGNGNGRGRR